MIGGKTWISFGTRNEPYTFFQRMSEQTKLKKSMKRILVEEIRYFNEWIYDAGRARRHLSLYMNTKRSER